MLRAIMCAAGPEQMATDASLAVAEEPPWSPWRATALCLFAEAQLLLGDSERAGALFLESCAVAATLGNVNVSILSRAELAVIAMDGGRWDGAAEHLHDALAIVEKFRLSDYVLSAPAAAAAARLAVHRGDRDEADRQLVRAMRSRASCTFVLPWIAVRVRLQLAKTYAAIGRPGDRASPAPGDRRHLGPPAGSGRPPRPGIRTWQDPHRDRASNSGRRATPQPGGAPATPLPADSSHLQTDRGAAVRVPQHRQLGSRLDLPKTRRVLTQSSGAECDEHRIARRVAEITHPNTVPGRR